MLHLNAIFIKTIFQPCLEQLTDFINLSLHLDNRHPKIGRNIRNNSFYFSYHCIFDLLFKRIKIEVY